MDATSPSIGKVRALFEASIATKQHVLRDCLPDIVRIAEVCAAALRSGGKILFCGNGGSAADAQHLAAELLVRLRPHINRTPMAAISLTLDSSSMTACGNDYGYECYFERMVQGLGRPGDVLIGISTSGKSANVIRALQAARQGQMLAIGLLGGSGQPALAHCHHALLVPSTETGRIQESHITAGHAIMELIEDSLCAEATAGAKSP
jgi:D-sedoheptulose 7-phosphate isomerase